MFDVASAAARNGRDHMEDFVRIEPRFGGREDSLYAAVFDGHGGEEVARRAAEELHARVATALESSDHHGTALREAFREFDESVAREPCGSTAAVMILRSADLTVANAGDSHVALVSRRGSELLTVDHRLSNEAEYRRVVSAGARVLGPYASLPDGRGLMCTRSLGDREFRGIGIIAEPEVSARRLAVDDEWLLLGSDGVWDGLDPDEVGRLARSTHTAQEAAERVRDAAVSANSDNVSVIAVRLP